VLKSLVVLVENAVDKRHGNSKEVYFIAKAVRVPEPDGVIPGGRIEEIRLDIELYPAFHVRRIRVCRGRQRIFWLRMNPIGKTGQDQEHTTSVHSAHTLSYSSLASHKDRELLAAKG